MKERGLVERWFRGVSGWFGNRRKSGAEAMDRAPAAPLRRRNYFLLFKTDGGNRHVSPRVRRGKARQQRRARRIQRRAAA